ncbi:MAG TPA: CBS domain-containing protein [Steroidobacteraceae bacterium]|jgi:CBS domain-containing protein|nr:CBS domain-containing protein [Steroidobacteraceae bacterium]
MNAGSVCKRGVITVTPSDDLVAAAYVMREKHVGYLIVSEGLPARSRRIVGVLTDRDIVVAVLAQEVDAHALKVGDVMTRDPLIIEESQSIEAVLHHMREAGVRRVPVVDRSGALTGVLSIDDVLETIAEQLINIAGSIRNEQRMERAVRQ